MNIEKLYSIFSPDTELVCEIDNKNINPTLIIRTYNSSKANAIERLVACPPHNELGTPRVVVIDLSENEPTFALAFRGNPLTSDLNKLIENFENALK